METLDTWFSREVQSWRTGASIGWTLLSLPVVFTVYLTCANFQPLTPVVWIRDTLTSVLSTSFVIYAAILMGTCALWCVVTSATYRVVPEIVSTQIQKFFLLLKVQQLVHCAVCVTYGVVCAWVCTNVLGDRYTHLTIKTDRDEFLLNEYHLFMIIYGLYVGFCFFLFHYLHQNYYLQFPILNTSRFFRIRSSVLSVFLLSLRMVLRQTMFFYPMYWLFGQIPKDFIASNIGLQRSETTVDSIYGMLDMRLLWQTFLCGIFITFTLTFASTLYKIYNTEHYAFMIESSFEEQKNHCLINALTCEANQLIKYLGYLDLSYLSRCSRERRQQVFSLSQPGGHPHNWNKLCGACLTEINALNQKLQEYNWKVFSSVPVRPPTTDKTTSGPLPGITGDGHTSSLTFRGLANGAQTETQHQFTQKHPETHTSAIHQYLQKKPGFNTLLSELPDAKSRQLFANAQIHIWAVEALSCFAAASFTEDKYGVVQRSLPDIVTAIINLQENVEKHFKLASTGVRRHLKETGAGDVPLKYLLQTTLKASIYRVINVFGKHITNLQISSDTAKKIKLFMDYKE